jgi:hypothetical protein
MQRLVDDPALARRLGARGYPYDPRPATSRASLSTSWPSRRSTTADPPPRLAPASSPPPGPWRITFDTNPDTCNLRCIMCEEHSPHSPLQIRRKEAGSPRRLMPIELLAPHDRRGRRRTAARDHPLDDGRAAALQDFEEILELCREHGVKLNLTTNGTFPRPGARAWAERIVPSPRT